MRTKALGVILGLGLTAALLAPPTAEAGHRHSRSCHHGSGYSSYGYSNNNGYSYNNGYAPSYGYSYGYYPSYRYVPPPPVVYGGYYARPYPSYGYGYGPSSAFYYQGGGRCSRSHFSLHLGY